MLFGQHLAALRDLYLSIHTAEPHRPRRILGAASRGRQNGRHGKERQARRHQTRAASNDILELHGKPPFRRHIRNSDPY